MTKLYVVVKDFSKLALKKGEEVFIEGDPVILGQVVVRESGKGKHAHEWTISSDYIPEYFEIKKFNVNESSFVKFIVERKLQSEIDNEYNNYLFSKLNPEEQEFFTPIEGMEGPIKFKTGAILYYDKREGKYYDRNKDMYIDHETFQSLVESESSKYISEKETYREYFRNKLKEYEVKSPNELSDELKVKFFNEIKKEWK